MPLKLMKRAMYAVMLVLFCIFVGVVAEETSFINVILRAMGAAVIGSIFIYCYLFLEK
jgi:branched-subunit amino acid transport protein AzlD